MKKLFSVLFFLSLLTTGCSPSRYYIIDDKQEAHYGNCVYIALSPNNYTQGVMLFESCEKYNLKDTVWVKKK